MLYRRSRAREVALQLLFQHDRNPNPIARKAIEAFARERLLNDATATRFCLALYDGVLANRPAIDQSVSETAENWRLGRMLPVDRNLLRMGTYEMRFAPAPVPPAVAINEAIELARRFGSVDSPSFVNGILDKISKARPATTTGAVAPPEQPATALPPP